VVSRVRRQRLEAALARAARGSPEAREEVFSLLAPRLLALAKQRVGEEAEDVVQETLIIVNGQLPTLAAAPHPAPHAAPYAAPYAAERLLTFAHTVLRNKIGNLYRKRDRREPHHVALEAVQEPGMAMDEVLEARELARLLARGIARLAETRPLCGQLFEGLRRGRELQALAAGLNLSRPRLDDHLYRCRKALRRLLAEEFGHDPIRRERERPRPGPAGRDPAGEEEP